MLAKPLEGPNNISIANINETNVPTVIVSKTKSYVDSKIIPDNDAPTKSIIIELFVPSVSASFK